VENINCYLLQDHFQVLPLFQHVLICHLPHLMINHQVRACAVPELEISQEVSFTCSRFIISTSCCIISTCNCIICCVNAVKPKCLHSAYQNFHGPFFRRLNYSQPSLLISCIKVKFSPFSVLFTTKTTNFPVGHNMVRIRFYHQNLLVDEIFLHQ
jgi:hypothetical protein